MNRSVRECVRGVARGEVKSGRKNNVLGGGGDRLKERLKEVRLKESKDSYKDSYIDSFLEVNRLRRFMLVLNH